jgi:hypothetical protein
MPESGLSRVFRWAETGANPWNDCETQTTREQFRAKSWVAESLKNSGVQNNL